MGWSAKSAVGHIPITPFIRPYPVRVGDYLRFARQSLLIGSLIGVDLADPILCHYPQALVVHSENEVWL
jgi:hypothetical protein